ncbi:MAG: isoprenyl transferase [Oscillospiraceae bacterium]|nr:isoprenyl transferase [Oscillospiraceae bacterium]
MELTDIDKNNLPKHIAIIMDGNRRWAKERGLTTKEGHIAGAKNLEKIGQYCSEIGIKHLTVYAFSTENWKRSEEEIAALMLIFRSYLHSFSKKADKHDIKVNILGDPSAFDKRIQKGIQNVIEKTKNNTGFVLNVALNYGGRAEITNAAKKIASQVKNGEIDVEDITEDLITDNLYTGGQPDPDLFIRPSYELRTSNFLTWQLAYTEFYFSKKNWPEFDEEELLTAIKEYQNRNRRFGGRPDEEKKA